MPPRTILPKDEQGSSEGLGILPSPKPSKRKAVSSACIPCRKRKSKCDGGLPSCSTCLAVYRTDCNYDQDTDHRRKGALCKDMQSLQVKNSALDVIVNSLRALPDAEATALFHSLRRGERLDLLADSLGGSASDMSLQTLDADLSEQTGSGTPGSSFHAQTPNLRSSETSRSPGEKSWEDLSLQSAAAESAGTWFRVPQDAEFIDHLLNLYMSWVHPFYTIFSKDHFLKDMARGGTKHCNAMLVNAVLALACHYSDRPATRMDPSRPDTTGDYFFSAARDYDSMTEEPSLTTVQALAVMAIREASAGRDYVAYRYVGRCMRMAMEIGLHLSEIPAGQGPMKVTDIEIRRLTFWGVYNLEIGCCLALGRTSCLTKHAINAQKPSLTHEKLDALIWQPYTDVNLPISPSAQHPFKCLLFVSHLSKLSEIVNDINLNLYAPKERFTPRRLAAAYNQYQTWYNELPDMFHLQNTALPHVIVLHMYYHMCVLHLLRPFMKLDLSAIGLFPREICTFCANEISSLMNALRGMYGLRRVSLAVTGALLSASTVHLLNLPSQSAALQLTQALQDLQTMSINHRYAGCCIDIIHRLANQWGIMLPDSALNTSPFSAMETGQFSAPNMSIFYTQATLSNESSESIAGLTHNPRHDSGSIFEPSFISNNFTISPQHEPTSSSQQSMHSTPLQSTPIQGAQSMWSGFPPPMGPHDLSHTDFPMMNHPGQFAFHPFQPQG